MASGPNLPEIKSAKIIHLSELETWKEDDIHGNAVRILGRIISSDIIGNVIEVEYHRCKLTIDVSLLGNRERLHPPDLFQFIGELERENKKFVLRARIARDMKGLNTDLYDRCLKIRREFEKNVLDVATEQPDSKGDGTSSTSQRAP